MGGDDPAPPTPTFEPVRRPSPAYGLPRGNLVAGGCGQGGRERARVSEQTRTGKGEHSLDAVTPGLTLGTLYSSGVGTDKTKQHTAGSKQPLSCKDCGGTSICQHNRQRSRCKDCGCASICQHNHIRSRRKDRDCGAPASAGITASLAERALLEAQCAAAVTPPDLCYFARFGKTTFNHLSANIR